MKRISLLLMLFFSINLLSAQDLESELGFIYVKANYLLDTDRYEESIAEYTRVIDIDPAYEDALFKRATAKFAIAAFAGTKKDLLLAFEAKGITPESILLFGKALKNLGEHEAGTETLRTAAMLYDTQKESSRAPSKRMPKSGDTRTTPDDNNDQTQTEEKSTQDKIKEGMDDIDSKVNDILDDILGKDEAEDTTGDESVDEPAEDVYVPDNSVNEIYIDEDLTIYIKNGLGGRKILEQPNILILSETSGEVTVDVCVNRNGKVTSAVFNKGKSTLSIQSLVSLAVRKSKEFWFESVDKDEVCGTIVFQITGRS